MDYDWSPASTRPPKLYRVYRPYQHTILSPRGLTASNPTLYLHTNLQYSLFLQTITDHRNQVAHKPTPYISFFSSKEEAESWALAAEDEFLKPAYILEIDVGHVSMKNTVMWSVQDIMDKSGNELGLGGMRNSEWLVLWQVPKAAISRTFKSSTDIRVERGLRFPVYVENPNRPSEKDGIWDEKWFNSGYQVTGNQNGLGCGCPDEMGYIHYEWPKSTPAAGTTGMSMMGFAAEEGVVVARDQVRGGVDGGVGMGQQSQQVWQVQQVEHAFESSMMGKLQQGNPDVGMVRMEPGQPSEGVTAQGGQHRFSENNGIVLHYQSPPPTQEQRLKAGTNQGNREIGEQAIQQPQRDLPAGEEHHAFAKQARDVMPASERPPEENLSTFEKAVENSHASRKFALHLGGRRGNSKKPVVKPE